MAKTTSDSILGVIRKFELVLTRRTVLADKKTAASMPWCWRRSAVSDCFFSYNIALTVLIWAIGVASFLKIFTVFKTYMQSCQNIAQSFCRYVQPNFAGELMIKSAALKTLSHWLN